MPAAMTGFPAPMRTGAAIRYRRDGKASGCAHRPGRRNRSGHTNLGTGHGGQAERARVGNRVIIHNGAVIGSDGVGYVGQGESWEKIPQVGGVGIGGDVDGCTSSEGRTIGVGSAAHVTEISMGRPRTCSAADASKGPNLSSSHSTWNGF